MEQLPNQEDKGLERTKAEPQDIDELYEQTDRYFFLLQNKAEVKPWLQGGVLTETVETPPINGKILKLSRIRPAYENDPTRIAHEAPLARVDTEGRNVYHTPVEIDVVDVATDKVTQRISVARSGPDRTGKHIDGNAHDMDRGLDKESADLTKAELDDIMSRLKTRK